jgi:hypothetical protein
MNLLGLRLTVRTTKDLSLVLRTPRLVLLFGRRDQNFLEKIE